VVLDTGTAFESSLGTLSVPVGTILAGTGVGIEKMAGYPANRNRYIPTFRS